MLTITPDLESRPLFEDELLFALAPGHGWNDGRPLSKEDISREPLILYQRGSPTSRIVAEYFREQQISPTTSMEIGSIPAIKEMVKLNLGIGVLTPWVIEYELAKGLLRMRALGAKRLKRTWAMTSLSKKRLGIHEERFFALCRARATAMRLDRRDLSSAWVQAKSSPFKYFFGPALFGLISKEKISVGTAALFCCARLKSGSLNRYDYRKILLQIQVDPLLRVVYTPTNHPE